MGLVFNSNEPFKTYEKAANGRGWEPYQLPTAAAFFKIIGEEVIRGSDYTESEIESVYDAVVLEFQTKGIDKNMDNLSKQQKYDALILKAFWLTSMFELAKKDSPEIQELAKQMLADNSITEKGVLVSEHTTKSSESKSNSKTIKGPQPETTSSPASRPSASNTAAIEDIILRTVTSYGLNGVYVKNEVNVLYKNGEMLTNPSEPLETLDIAASKRKNPKKWDRWRKKGNIIYVTRSKNGKTYDWKKWFDLRPGNKGFSLNGTFNTLDPFGGSTVINASTVAFTADGKFAWKTIKGGDTDWKAIYSKSSSAGTYRIHMHTITLNYNNGNSESFFFGRYPKDDQHFIIGSSHFVPVEK